VTCCVCVTGVTCVVFVQCARVKRCDLSSVSRPHCVNVSRAEMNILASKTLHNWSRPTHAAEHTLGGSFLSALTLLGLHLGQREKPRLSSMKGYLCLVASAD